MIALLLLSCSLSGHDCRYALINDQLTPMQCMIASMTEPAHYLSEHPNRVFRKAVCTRAERIGRFLGRDSA